MKDSGRQKHILIVDDEEAIAYVFRRYFERAGFRVSVAHDGDTAFQLSQADRIDALVTDLKMPGMNGAQLVESIHGIAPGIPAIIVSAYAAELAASFRSARIMNKPVEVARLVSCMQEMLAHTETGQD